MFINYGEKGNADLLLLYGFALERNPFNAGEVSGETTSLFFLFELVVVLMFLLQLILPLVSQKMTRYSTERRHILINLAGG